MKRPAQEPQTGYRFGNVQLDVDRREISVDGQLVELQPKAFDLLHYLIRHRDRVVDREELMDALWPGIVVTDDSLTQALRRVRRVIGDDGTRQEVIRTIQRRGFRFVAEMNAGQPVEAPADPTVQQTEVVTSARREYGGSGQAVRAAPPNAGTSLAVLPFLDLSPARDQRYFCDGIAEELANALGRVPGLRIAARTSAFAFREAAIEAPEIARRLGVDALVEGSVRRSGEQLRVTAKLVDAGGFQSWTGTWDRALADVFAIQEEIARQVVEALGPRLAGPESVAMRPVRGTSIEAYDLYLRGLGSLHKFGRRSQRFALRMFGEAIELDPSYAPAWAGVAISHLLLYSYSEASEENRQGAIDAAERAVALDPLSAEAQVAAANAAMLSGDVAAADAGFRRAQALDPGLFQAWYYHGRCCASRGDHQRAVELYERAAAVRPDDYDALILAAQSYTSLGRTDDAHGAYLRSLANAERALQLQPDDVRVIALCASSHIVVGRPDESRRWVERALALEPDEPYVNYCAACTFGLLGETDRALDCLERVGVEKMANANWMDHDSSLDPLRGHPRFEALRKRAR